MWKLELLAGFSVALKRLFVGFNIIVICFEWIYANDTCCFHCYFRLPLLKFLGWEYLVWMRIYPCHRSILSMQIRVLACVNGSTLMLVHVSLHHWFTLYHTVKYFKTSNRQIKQSVSQFTTVKLFVRVINLWGIGTLK